MPRAIHCPIQISGTDHYCPRGSALVHFAWNFPRKLVKVAYHWLNPNESICALVKACCHWLTLVKSYKYNRNSVGLLKCLREMLSNNDVWKLQAFGYQ